MCIIVSVEHKPLLYLIFHISSVLSLYTYSLIHVLLCCLYMHTCCSHCYDVFPDWLQVFLIQLKLYNNAVLWVVLNDTNPDIPHHFHSQREPSWMACQREAGVQERFPPGGSEWSSSLIHCSVTAFSNLLSNQVILQFVAGGEGL